jgi:hypothetical protein
MTENKNDKNRVISNIDWQRGLLLIMFLAVSDIIFSLGFPFKYYSSYWFDGSLIFHPFAFILNVFIFYVLAGLILRRSVKISYIVIFIILFFIYYTFKYVVA